MSKYDKYDKAARGAAEYRERFDRREKAPKERESRRDRGRDSYRSRRYRSPSYDSETDSDSDSYDTVYSRDPSPRRVSRRHTTAYSDTEDNGYHRGRGRERRHRDRDYPDYSPSPERKSIVEDLLAAVGLIQSKHSDRGYGSSRSRDADEGKKNTRQALQAALTAAAMEAFRTRKEGKLTPQRIMQIAGAAVAAGGLDALVERSGSNSGSLRNLVESVVAGLATGQTLGKSTKQNRGRGIDKVKTGIVGMAAKQLLARSLSRGANLRRRQTNKY